MCNVLCLMFNVYVLIRFLKTKNNILSMFLVNVPYVG